MRTRARTVLLLASSSALFGCQPGCETAGLSDIFDTSPTFVRFPGRQLAKGHFSGFTLDGTPTERGFLLVRDQDQDEALTVVPIKGSEPCQVGPAARYWSFLSMVGLLEEKDKQTRGYIAFLPSVDETSGTGTLQFATFGCEVTGASLPGVRSPLRTGVLLSPPTFIAIQSDAKLSTVSPWTGTSTVVAESVTDAAFDGSYFWTIEGGELGMRNAVLSEVARFSGGVAGYRMDGGGTGYFLDAQGQLLRVDGPDEPPTPLAPDACGISTPRGASNYVATLSPCADSQLVLVDPTTHVTHPLAAGSTTDVFAPVLSGPSGAQQYFIYTTEVDPATGLGKLWAVGLEPQQAPVVISEAASIKSLAGAVDGRVPLIVDSVGGIGRLVLWSPSDGMQEIAQGVADYNLPLVLEKYDAATGTGTLSFRHSDGKLQRLGSGVPNLGQSFVYKDPVTKKVTSYRAILTDFENGVGNLVLVTQQGDNLEVTPVADSVPSRAYLFFEFAEALTYLIVDKPDAPTGRLEVLFLMTGEKFGTDGVSEWMGMDWPEVGIAYAVQEGKQAGIWWGALE
jgi:hypothetical protein